MAFMGRSISGLMSPLALLIVGVADFACYKPNILDGGLRCKADAGARSCPEGFKCRVDTQTCWRNLDGGADQKVDGPGVPDVADGPDAPDGPICFEQKAGCSAEAGLCDPFCQTGCGCRDKCSVNTAGALTCNPPLSSMFPRALLQSCTISSNGSGAQTDNCAPGLVCVQDLSCSPRCFQFCRTDGDCVNSSCSREVGSRQDGGVTRKVCDIPFVDSCVPLPGSQNTGCGTGAMACYISSASPTHTICDCPFNAGSSNDPCTRTRDCVPGLACVDRGDGAPICLQVCRLSNMGLDCISNPAIGACKEYTGLPPGPAHHPTFGFCL